MVGMDGEGKVKDERMSSRKTDQRIYLCVGNCCTIGYMYNAWARERR